MKKLIALSIMTVILLTSCGVKDITDGVRRCFLLPSENECTLEVNGAVYEARMIYDGADVLSFEFHSGELDGMTKKITADSVSTKIGSISSEDKIQNEPLTAVRRAFIRLGAQEYKYGGELSEFGFSDGELEYSLVFDTAKSSPVSVTVCDGSNEVKINYC